MTGAEHYAEAERLLTHPGLASTDTGPDDALMIAAAQVHATLALAAATADPDERYASRSSSYGFPARDVP